MREATQLISQQVEHALARRNLAPFSRKIRSADSVSFGIAALDALTTGVPVGAMTEIVGPESSGRTTVALSVVASLLRSGPVCAWIDVADVLEPESAAANGVDLARLLWIRCGSHPRSVARPSGTDAPNAPASVQRTSATQPTHLGGGSPHPRSEGRDMPEAVAAMLKAHGGPDGHQVHRGKRLIGTPGAPNRPLSHRSDSREEQVNSDRLPARRGDNLTIVSRRTEPPSRPAPNLPAARREGKKRSGPFENSPAAFPSSPLQALDQGLRAADLLLHNGGFSVIVFDLGSIPPEVAWRIPLATWFRFRAACERTRTSLILLTQHPCARSSAELVLRLSRARMEAQGDVMMEVHYAATTERSRSAESGARILSIRRQPQSERPGQWTCGAAWA